MWGYVAGAIVIILLVCVFVGSEYDALQWSLWKPVKDKEEYSCLVRINRKTGEIEVKGSVLHKIPMDAIQMNSFTWRNKKYNKSKSSEEA